MLTFADPASLDRWLDEHGATSCLAAVRQKGAAEDTISKSDAIDCALAQGWVDGQLGQADEHFFKTRFTPRRLRSIRSQVNRERIERLEVAGRMLSAGRTQVENAKMDGRWAATYARQSDIAPNVDFISALDAEPAARELFSQLDAANRFAILFRIRKAATLAKRTNKIAELVTMLNQGETIHPRKQKRGRAIGTRPLPIS